MTADRERCGFCERGRMEAVWLSTGDGPAGRVYVDCPYCDGSGYVQEGDA